MMSDLLRAPARRCLMAVKLDMERAYDRVRWDFLVHAMERFGLHGRWIEWVLGCVRGPSFAILVNGSPTSFFQSSIGLRQGCPLSPFLFIMCADLLSCSLRAACQLGSLHAYLPCPGATPISHLLFADDCLIVTRASLPDARELLRILEEYCLASGQKVNASKSSIVFSPRTCSRVRQSVTSCLQMPEHVGLWSYLGVPITGRALRVSECSALVERVRGRLEGWRAGSLSMMGRVTLIRSVLCSIPIHLMALSVVPIGVLRSVERLLRNFLWHSGGGRRGVHLVAWDSVCRPLDEGGLGVQSLVGRRETLLARHAARFVLEPQGLWSQVMRVRYGGLDPAAGSWGTRRGSFIWRAFSSFIPRVCAHSRWAIGDGRAVAVLEDPWLDSLPLRLWPTFISMDVGAELRVADLLRPDGAGWDLTSVSLLFGGPLAERVLMVAVPGGGGPDVRLWSSSCSSQVRLRDLASLFRDDLSPTVESGWVWRFGLHPRVALFLWKVAWGRLPTCEFLSHRGLSIPTSCSDCGEAESLDHVLLRCPRAARVWQLAGASVAALQSSESLVRAIRTWAIAESSRLAALRFTCLAYQIWGARNARIFRDSFMPTRLVLERAWALADEMSLVVHCSRSLIARRTWGSTSATAASRMIFITWEPPPPSFLKVNFDGSVSDRGRRGGAGFVIRDPSSRLIAVGGCQISDTSVPGAELRAAWAGLRFARCRLGASTIVLEGDSATVIGWIRDRAERGFRPHPLLGDIWRMVDGCVAFEARHIYREGNGAADWMASYAAYHQGDVLWEGTGLLPQALRIILLSDSSGCIYSRVLN